MRTSKKEELTGLFFRSIVGLATAHVDISGMNYWWALERRIEVRWPESERWWFVDFHLGRCA